MKNYLFFLTVCMYTTIFFAAEDKVAVADSPDQSIAQLNRQLQETIQISKCALAATLLEKKADISSLQQDERDSLLKEAVRTNHTDLMQTLLDSKADINILRRKIVGSCCGKISWEIQAESPEAIGILFKHFQKIHQQDPEK